VAKKIIRKEKYNSKIRKTRKYSKNQENKGE